MTRPRYKPHPDANQSAIVAALETAGCYVEDCSRWASVFDLAVWGYDAWVGDHCWHLLEVKTSEGTLTEEQRQFQEDVPGAVQVVRSAHEALCVFGRIE